MAQELTVLEQGLEALLTCANTLTARHDTVCTQPDKMKSIRRLQSHTEGRYGRKFAAGFLASSVTFLGQRSGSNCEEVEYLFRLDNVADDLEAQTAFSFEVVLKKLPPEAQLPAIGGKWFDRRGTTLLISEVRVPGTKVAGAWKNVTPIKTAETPGASSDDPVWEGHLCRALEMKDCPWEASTKIEKDPRTCSILALTEELRKQLKCQDSQEVKRLKDGICKLCEDIMRHYGKRYPPIEYEEAEPGTVHSFHQAIAYVDACEYLS